MPVKLNTAKDAEIRAAADAERREALCISVSSERVKRLGAGFEYNEVRYPMDIEAQGVYTALANAITAGIEHLNIIRTMDNRTVQVSDADMTAIGTACLNAAGAINIAAWQAKDAIRAAVSCEAALNVFDQYMNNK